MGIWLFVGGLVVICGLAFAFSRVIAQDTTRGNELVLVYPYDKRKKFYSAEKKAVLGLLEYVFQDEYKIMINVRLSDIVSVAPGLNANTRSTAVKEIEDKSADFVVCSYTDLAVQMVVQLDDVYHTKRERQARNSFVDDVLSSAGIPVCHIRPKSEYSPDDARKTRSIIVEAFKKTVRRETDPELTFSEEPLVETAIK